MSTKYKIKTSEKNSESYFYSDTTYYFDVVRIQDDKVMHSFMGQWSQGKTHDSQTGVESVKMIDETLVEIKYYGAKVERIQLE